MLSTRTYAMRTTLSTVTPRGVNAQSLCGGVQVRDSLTLFSVDYTGRMRDLSCAVPDQHLNFHGPTAHEAFLADYGAL